jgi:hypothetical protein
LLLFFWCEFFDEKCVTSQEVIDLANDEEMMGDPDVHKKEVFLRWTGLRATLDILQVRNSCDLDRILEEVKGEEIYNFLVERDGSCAPPMKWRAVKQEHEYRMITDEEREAFLAARKEAALKIDAATAEVSWSYEQTLDPYGIYPDLPPELRQTGREYFARAPGNDIWVWFRDLPDETRDALEKSRSKEDDFPRLWLKGNKEARADDN